MATAPSRLRTVAGNPCLGSVPDSWGVRFPKDEHQVPYTRSLDELAQVTAEDLSFGKAVRRGVRVSPPAGVPNPADAVAELAGVDAELFAMVEQDLYPFAPGCRCPSRSPPANT